MGNTLNLQCWDTAVSGNPNGNADAGINLVEGQLPGDLNDAGRAIMASARRYAKDVGGAIVAGGTANALTVATSQNLSAAHLTAGLFLAVRATADSTNATVTLEVDGITAKNIKRSDGSALAVGSIRTGSMLLLFYNQASTEFRAANILPASQIASDGAAAFQPLDADLTTLAGLAKTDGGFIVGDGANWTVETGATARASLSLGTMAIVNSPAPVANGGTGASSISAMLDTAFGSTRGMILVRGTGAWVAMPVGPSGSKLTADTGTEPGMLWEA